MAMDIVTDHIRLVVLSEELGREGHSGGGVAEVDGVKHPEPGWGDVRRRSDTRGDRGGRPGIRWWWRGTFTNITFGAAIDIFSRSLCVLVPLGGLRLSTNCIVWRGLRVVR